MKCLMQNYLNLIFEDIQPMYYKNSYIDFSYLTEMNHFSKRAANKKRNIYSDNEIVKIVQNAIDKFITDSTFKKYRDNPGISAAKNFTIISKSHDEIKIKAKIWKNGKRERINAIMNDKPIVDYVCRLITILTKDMVDYTNDISLIVENNSNKSEIIYVD